MKRGMFQGVTTVVRFNWHFYVLAFVTILTLSLAAVTIPGLFAVLCIVVACGILLSCLLSLVATYLAYDSSELYQLHWMDPWMPQDGTAANIHAGFDETTGLLSTRWPGIRWQVFDFFDSAKHTEVSIRRARNAHPPSPDTHSIATHSLPIPEHTFDRILLILAAHEIRNPGERSGFFLELGYALKKDGLIIVTEHLRDPANLIAYNLGAWHFHTPEAWIKTFRDARLDVVTSFHPAPLITTYILKKHGTSA